MLSKEDLYIGKRLSFDGALCTVRYHGPLSGTKGSWLGVEWDDTNRGKHDGTHQGQRMFSCLSTSTTAASFVRPTRPRDSPRTFLEALRFKYAGKDKVGEADLPVEISGKTVEEVGFEKIRRQQAELQHLRVAVVDELQMCGIGRGTRSPKAVNKAQEEIKETCANIVELDLGWSLLESWQDVADICRPLKKLRILKVSGVRLRSFSIESNDSTTGPFMEVLELHLNETLLRPTQFARMLNGHFPRLKILSLAQNELGSMGLSEMMSLPNVETLILEKNTFKDLFPLVDMSSAFPRLKDLSLQQNHIDKIGKMNVAEVCKLNLFNNLGSLNLSRNKIEDFMFVDQVALLFPNLASLRISQNPLYEKGRTSLSAQSTSRSDVAYSFTVARIPSLTVLNHTAISARDREESEIYYISAAAKDITCLLEGPINQDKAVTFQLAKMRHPRYEALCRQYDREPVFNRYTTESAATQSSKPSQLFAAGSLAARLIEATFYVSHSSQETFKRKIPRTIDVYRVKALISREVKLQPLQFRLIYESEELDPIRDGIEQKSSDWENWGDWNVDDDIESETEIRATPEKTLREMWIDGIVLRDGKKWKKREIEIVEGTKAWGDYIGDDEIRAVNIRVEPLP